VTSTQTRSKPVVGRYETDVGRFLYYGVQAVLLAKIVLTIFVFDVYAADTFSLPKSAVAHTASVLLLALIALLALVEPKLITRSALHIGVLALLIAFAVATAFAADTTVGLYGISRRYLGLSQMADNVVLYAAAAMVLRTVPDFRRALVVLGTASVIVAGYAILQFRGHDFVKYPEPSAFATFGQPDIAGGYFGVAAVTFGVIGGLGLVAGTRRVASAALLAVGLLCTAAAAVGGVRNGVLAIAAGLVAAIVLVSWRGNQVRRIAIALGASTVVVAAIVALSPVGLRLRPDVLLRDSAGRLEIWAAALKLWTSHPLLGLGPDNFGVGYPSVRSEVSVSLNGVGVLQNSPHDWFLYIATSAGIVGVLAFAAVLAAAWLVIVRGNRQAAAILAAVPLAAYLGQSAVNVGDVALDWIPWVCLGVLAGTLSKPWPTKGVPVSARPTVATSIVVAFLIGAFVFTGGELARIQASEALAASTALVSRGSGAAAVESARIAVAADRNRPEYWNGFGAALSAAGNPGAAAQGFAEAASRAPWEPTYWRNLALARLAASDASGASAALQRATQADPFDAQSLDLLARLEFNRGYFTAAAAQGAVAARLMPRNAGAFDAPVLSYLHLDRPSEAEALLRNALSVADSAHLRGLLARVLYSENRLSDALVEVTRALAIDPAEPEALAVRTLLGSK